MKKINRPFLLFWSDISLITPDNCQRVTRNIFKINMLQIAKNENTERTGQNDEKGIFGNLSGENDQKGVLK